MFHYPYIHGSSYALWKNLVNHRKIGIRALYIRYRHNYGIFISIFPDRFWGNFLTYICKLGKLSILMQVSHTINYIESPLLLYWSCFGGNLALVKWIYSKGCISECQDAIHMACANGHMHVAKWLYSIGGHQMCRSTDNIREAIRNGHTRVFKWLYSIGCRADNLASNYVIIDENLKMLGLLIEYGCDLSHMMKYAKIQNKPNVINFLMSNKTYREYKITQYRQKIHDLENYV